MANIKLVFLGTEKSSTENTELQCYHNTRNEIYLCIQSENDYPSFICLDKHTAIKFHKELKKQISYFEEEVSNGI